MSVLDVRGDGGGGGAREGVVEPDVAHQTSWLGSTSEYAFSPAQSSGTPYSLVRPMQDA